MKKNVLIILISFLLFSGTCFAQEISQNPFIEIVLIAIQKSPPKTMRFRGIIFTKFEVESYNERLKIAVSVSTTNFEGKPFSLGVFFTSKIGLQEITVGGSASSWDIEKKEEVSRWIDGPWEYELSHSESGKIKSSEKITKQEAYERAKSFLGQWYRGK